MFFLHVPAFWPYELRSIPLKRHKKDGAAPSYRFIVSFYSAQLIV